MGYRFRIITFAAALALVSFGQLRAEAESPRIGSEFGVLDQIVTSSFEPISLIVLQEVELGKVRQYQAISAVLNTDEARLPLEESNDSSRRLVGAGVDLDSSSEQDFFHFTFFMASEDSGFAATETKRWSFKELRDNSPTVEELSSQMAALRHRLKIKRVAAIDLDEKLDVLKRKASSIADVDGIIKLKMTRASLENVESDKDLEIIRLRELSELGRKLPEPKDIALMRSALAQNLRDAAKITSMADRLNRRKNQAAEQHFKRKLNLIKEMKSVNPEVLAQKILELRKTRREYETRLGISSATTKDNDF